MIIVSYDFSDDKRRAKFAKFLERFGSRIQYSVFRIKNSKRVLDTIVAEVDNEYKNQFEGTDSVVIFRVCEGCMNNIKRYGSAAYEDDDVVFL
ncbi:CRISPR-associated endonuclease Cas2 [candidate division WWE3 bacterium CG22_combo_CG10-13_8_21_14_all_39_12]|uniref:CRISPR-associated endoribonuclease Cas2 n=2 Tax=Katanobacteria TaxID=422282 RepID=A0A2M7X2B0_UNCKA|nr:MAG: CRISPR-associated endonuclease Cas2 [candidate division WWE3 bacterium CG22_combo_CG10-13_8_21_14_all_39_12]PJA40302.1 MAG: CRISPR-associated endonuclease Cas2 [candidate division WWE3 bacterium CG_4_9_14_3_um_filter_39_7]